jgi:hypothetical protein
MIVGLLPGVPAVVVTPDIVSLVVLPPLLFAAGEELPWRDLRAVRRPKFSLSNRSADRCNRCNNLTAAPSAVQRYQVIDNPDYRRSEDNFTRYTAALRPFSDGSMLNRSRRPPLTWR